MSKPSIVKMLTAGAIGNLIEWYNFLIYAFLAQTISTLFFPSHNPTLGLIKVYGVFAISFLVRPLGSFVFGYIGDKYGRQRSLMIALVMMAISSLAIASLPTYASWGFWSPLVFMLLHIMQGISIGGEYTGSVIYLGEHAPDKHRGLWVSIVPTTTALGILTGSLVSLIFVNLFSTQDLLSWGWRIPFALGSIFCLFGAYLRRHMPETPVYAQLQQSKQTANFHVSSVFTQPGVRINTLRLILLVCCYGVFYQMLYIWLPTYLETTAHFSRQLALMLSSGYTLLFMLLLPINGWLCDRWRAHKLVLVSSIILFLMSYPLFLLLKSKSLWLIHLGMGSMTFIFSNYAASVTRTMVDLFPGHLRYTALSFGYNLGFALFGGTAPLVLTTLLGMGHHGLLPALYLLVSALCAIVGICLRPKSL